MCTIFYIAPACFGPIILSSWGSWHQNFFKTYRRVQLKCNGTWWRKEGKWRGNWWMEWVASTLHTTSEHGVSSITTADGHNLAANSQLNWCPHRFKWTCPFHLNMKSGFCACAITFQMQSTKIGHSKPTYVVLSAVQNCTDFG
jgi:hypothetical protein